MEFPGVPAEDARFHIVPVPLERSVSYGKGTQGGPAAILHASRELEAFDGRGTPGKAGIYTAPAIDCAAPRSTEDVLAEAGQYVARAVRGGHVPIVLGGEHTVSIGPVKALVESGETFGVVQFDAHADLRDAYEGNALSHACAAKRILDLGIPVFQIGVRSLSEPEALLRVERGIPHRDAEECLEGGPAVMALPDGFPRTLYVTFDVDALDPSIMPSTGTPEPGGLTWTQAVAGLRIVLRGRRLLAADVVELAPIPGMHAPDFTAAKLVYTLMGLAE